MLNTIGRFTKRSNNLNIILGNKKVTYNKDNLGYEPKTNAQSFKKLVS